MSNPKNEKPEANKENAPAKKKSGENKKPETIQEIPVVEEKPLEEKLDTFSGEINDHEVTNEDIADNPELKDQGVKEGDILDFDKPEEQPATEGTGDLESQDNTLDPLHKEFNDFCLQHNLTEESTYEERLNVLKLFRESATLTDQNKKDIDHGIEALEQLISDQKPEETKEEIKPGDALIGSDAPATEVVNNITVDAKDAKRQAMLDSRAERLKERQDPNHKHPFSQRKNRF